MQTPAKIQSRSDIHPILLTPAQWEAIEAILASLRAAFAPALRPLTEAERRNLLPVRIANEAFAQDYVALIQAHPGVVPSLLRPDDTVRDWQTRERLLAFHLVLTQLTRDVADTLAGLSSDCYAATLAAYRMLARDGAPAGMSSVVAPLRKHVAEREEKKRRTRALNLAIANASAANDATAPAANAAPPTTAPTAMHNRSAPAALAA